MKKKPIKSLLFDVSQQDQINNRANPKLLRVLLSEQTTRLDFGYVATAYYHKGGWITISPDTYLQIKGSPERYLFKEAEGIALAPEKLNFESNKDYQFFSLYFEALPGGNLVFDMIEHYPGTPNDFNYYGIELRLEDGVEVVS
jgi:hypothetical protein